MGFAARLQEASNHEAAQKGPVSQGVAKDVITAALQKAVKENGLTALYPPDGPRLHSVLEQLTSRFNMAAFCQRFKIPPLIAGDLMQVALYDVQLFIDDSGSMNEGDKWDDARAIVTQIVNITTQFDLDGIDVEFMNSPVSGKRIKNPDDVAALFDQVGHVVAHFAHAHVPRSHIRLHALRSSYSFMFLSLVVESLFHGRSGSAMWLHSSRLDVR